ncbi:TrkH family potassium uptake protein [Pleionea sp. CnH1-48]|uniref:TrkH family potassium uptake protein n=1 Tax=Pleionea sp. CnH1-48 TaxID=2954494 RepID=UPI0020977482|nr:TrkH family potassium uptake protein [Pleionea sp. CnH1-48]MCO7226573.1 TrkH family potassium uptake protein [Pleionea sp. CnH1-48]
MQPRVIIRILGILLMVFSLTMLPPIGVSLYYKDGAGGAFLSALIMSLITGFVLFITNKKYRAELKIRDGFLIVVMFWTVLSLFGAIPLYLSNIPHVGIPEAAFESFSGLTTTGATVIEGLDFLPKSILYYRQQLQWLGGMGIIVLAVAILPMLGIGGMQLYRAETPGPVKDAKLTPRIAGTAKALWFIYLGLTVACAISYWLAGMTPFDAINHSFSTVAIGGFSTHDASIGWFNNSTIELVCSVFMLISGVNFSLHFVAYRQLSIDPYAKDPEFRAYITLMLIVAAICFIVLFSTQQFGFKDSIYKAIFHAISIGTTTGFASAAFDTWPSILPLLLLLFSFVGGCAGSTGGGIKVIRFLLLFKQGMREIRKLIHPNAVFSIKLGGQVLPEKVIDAIWGFFATYVALFVIMLLILVAEGMDQVTAFSAVAACMNNLGPGLGEVATNYSSLSPLSMWTLCVAMLFGRLEIFTLLVLFTPAFWRR